MQVELGTPRPKYHQRPGQSEDEARALDATQWWDPQGRPVITYCRVPDEHPFDPELDGRALRDHVASALMFSGGITNFPGAEAILSICHPYGAFANEAHGRPSWVWSDNPDMQRQLAEYFECPEGRPQFLDETHWRLGGLGKLAPGVPGSLPGLNALLTNVGATLAANAIGGGNGTQGTVTGLGTAATSTSLTTNFTTSSTTQFNGARVFAADTTNHDVVWGNVDVCTNGANSVLTVDQWYTPAGGVGTTPAAGWEFWIDWSSGPWLWIGLTTTNISPAATDTSLSGESTTLGMARALGTYTVTSAASGSSITFTVSKTFTFTGSSATTFYAMGLFTSAVKTDTTDTMAIESSFSGSFTVTNNGDQATVTDTVTLS